MSGKSYFGYSILTMGRAIEKAQTFGYFVRTALVAIGLMVVEFALAMSLSFSDMVNVVHIFTSRLIEGGEASMRNVLAVLILFWLIHFLACFVIGWKKFKTTRDGDKVASELFDDINHVVTQESEG
ncbi:MAG: hypothetical protein ACPGVT_05295 [Maricaulaceae bacterium]